MFATKGRVKVSLLVVGFLVVGLGMYAGVQVQEVEAQAGASASASAGWWSARASVSPYFNDDPELYPLNKTWRGSGQTYAGKGWSNGNNNNGTIYVKIVSLTLTSPTMPPTGGTASTSYNIARIKSRSVSKTAPNYGKCARGKGKFEGNTISGRYATWP